MDNEVVDFGGEKQKRRTKADPPPTGMLGDDYPVETPKDVAEAARKPKRTVDAAVQLALHGADYNEIARLCDYDTPAAARVAVENALAALYTGPDDLIALRAMTSARYEQLIRSLSPRALSDRVKTDRKDDKGQPIYEYNESHLAYARELRSTLDSFSRLHGFNTQNVNLMVTPEAAELNKVVQFLANAAQQEDEFGEEDIFVLEAREQAAIESGEEPVDGSTAHSVDEPLADVDDTEVPAPLDPDA